MMPGFHWSLGLAILALVACVEPSVQLNKPWKHGLDQVINVLKHVDHDLRHGATKSAGCQCMKSTYDCGCCVHLDIPEIHLDDTGCLNLTYLPKEYGVSLTFTIDGHVLVNDTISARNPPPLCFGVPYLEKAVSLCLDFYDLDITKDAFTGCAKIEARLYHVKLEDADLGCFKIPLAHKLDINDAKELEVQRAWLMEMESQRQWKRKKLFL